MPAAMQRAAAAVGPLGSRIGAGARSGAETLAAGPARISHEWHGLASVVRQRLAAAAIVLGLAILIVFVLIPVAPCGAPGGDDCPPGDDAIALVPADALAYAHLDIDRESDGFEATTSLVGRLPLLTALLAGEVADLGGGPIDFASQVRPWAGGEAALAVIPGSAVRPDRVTMIEAEDPDGAREFATGLIGPGAAVREIEGIEVSVGPRKSAAALVEGFLLLGDAAALTRFIEADGSGGTLETAAGVAAIDDLPDDRVAYAYLSGPGSRALLRGTSASALDTFVDSAASSGIAAALSVEGDVASLTVRSEVEPERAESSPGFFSALPQFDPALTADVGGEALAYLGLGDPGRSADSLLTQAARTAPALLSAFNRGAETLRREGGISVADELLPLLGSEAALSVEPVAAAGSGGSPGVLAPAGVPYVSLLAEGVDSEAAAAALADLQPSLVSALAPAGGEAARRVSIFEPLQIAGIEAQTFTVSPTVQLTYATYDDRLAVATDPLGIAQARSGGDGLDDSEDFRSVTVGMPDEVSLLAYLDLRDLISLGEQVGLATDPAYTALAADLRALDAAALAVTQGDGVIQTDLRIAVGEGGPAPAQALPPSGE